MYTQTTQVPNSLFDKFLSILTVAELKVILVIIRQTNGWINLTTKKRKSRDCITYRQFMYKTGLSRRIISQAVQNLIEKGLISVTNYDNQPLLFPKHRKGKRYLYYAPLINYKLGPGKSHIKNYIS